ncbi:MAG: tetratricopeptide repeat protein [Desulfobacterales bacterium]|nr:MAG: tetratricopeptide repeat protein [Desulfobacterales bacterium]
MENPSIRMNQLTFANLWRAAFSKMSAKSRPVGNISFALNYYFHKNALAGYHLVNIFIHIFSGILLWLFLKKTLQLKSACPEFVSPGGIALMGSLLWLVNPLQTQSVTYVIQRLNSMGAMFFMLSFLFYLNGRLQGRTGRKWGWFLGSALAWILALGCKQNTATLPFFIFLYEWYFFQDLSGDWLKHNFKYFLIILGVFTIVAFIYLGPSPSDRLSSISDYANKQFTLSERLMTQFRVVVYYLTLIIFPNPSRLNLDYDFPLSYSLIHPITTFLSLIFIVGLTILAVLLAKRQRLISFCIWWFLGNLVIESSVIPVAIIFEHRVYLPSMLVWLAPVILFHRYLKPRLLTVSICCVLVTLFSYWTFERNKVWRNEVTLWADCVKKSPNKARPYLNLGEVLMNRKRYDEALPNLLKAIQLDPKSKETYHNLGFLYDNLGESDKAIEQYRKAIQIDPNFAKAYNNLGVALTKQGKTDEALSSLQKALQIDPELPEAHMSMGVALAGQNKNDAAIEHFKKALQLNPDLPRAQFLLGDALLKRGQTEQGIHLIEMALQIDPDYAEAHNNLGGELLRQGKIDEALEHLTRSLSINPDLAEAHNNVGIIMIQKGNFDAAISRFQDALRIDPEFGLAKKNLQRALAIRNSMDTEIDNVQKELDAGSDDPLLHFKMGNLYLGKGELSKAIGEFEKALSLQPEFAEAQNNLALAYAADRQYDRALAAFKKLIELDLDNPSTYYNIAVLYALQNKVADAMAWLKRAIDKGYQNWELIKTDKDLANIRQSEDYKQLVKGH